MTRYSVPAYSYGAKMNTILGTVVHSAECPLKSGYAYSLAKNWFGTSKAGTSARGILDPRDIVDMTDRRQTTWHAGPKANPYFNSWEQAGYARYSRDEWLTDDGRKQIKLLAQVIKEDHSALGLPLTIVTDPKVLTNLVANRRPVGITFHKTVAKGLGGTTHTDPGDNYPIDVLQEELSGKSIDIGGINMTTAYFIVGKDGKVFCGNLMQFDWMRSESELQDRLNVLISAGIPCKGWNGSAWINVTNKTQVMSLAKVANPYAFGYDVSHPAR